MGASLIPLHKARGVHPLSADALYARAQATGGSAAGRETDEAAAKMLEERLQSLPPSPSLLAFSLFLSGCPSLLLEELQNFREVEVEGEDGDEMLEEDGCVRSREGKLELAR